jgi:hypothetical protein
MEPTQLAYIGTVNGLPVFVDRSTARPGILNLGPNTDLNRLLAESQDARTGMENVTTLYVPSTATGCSFIQLTKVQEVRKNDLQH